ncbi:hypothetical protein C8R45DRAFT_911009 [Mycena sanguinolenta]|nr:hypothetical protein C8R45DRAFT_911009 [Mycena sanguinolenta]
MAELPNPLTPLAFLPPVLAGQFQVSQFLFAATLGAYIWDILLNLGNDYTLLFKHKIRFPTLVYFLSRIFTMSFILTAFILQATPVENCNALALAFSICTVLTQATTATLFYLRVTTVWHPNKIAYAVFSFLLLAVIGGGIATPIGVRAVHIGPTTQCITAAVPTYVDVAAIIPLINDTAIFLAITYRILMHTMVANSSMARLRGFVSGTGLSTVSRALLQSGQHFYFVAVAVNAPVIILIRLPVPAVYRGMLSIPALATTNAMACLVFRRIQFGRITSDGTIAQSQTAFRSGADFNARVTPGTLSEFGSNTTFPMDIGVQKQINKFADDAVASQVQPSSKSATLV